LVNMGGVPFVKSAFMHRRSKSRAKQISNHPLAEWHDLCIR
jgi:hypothetical protein